MNTSCVESGQKYHKEHTSKFEPRINSFHDYNKKNLHFTLQDKASHLKENKAAHNTYLHIFTGKYITTLRNILHSTP